MTICSFMPSCWRRERLGYLMSKQLHNTFGRQIRPVNLVLFFYKHMGVMPLL
jgi:hypothetical protein